MRKLITLGALMALALGAAAAGEAEQPVTLGKVKLYKNARRIEIQGRVCLQEGPLEYLAVLKGGKEYESVLSFDCKAIDLNLALIGAGYKASGGVRKIGDPRVPKGDPLYLYVEWTVEDPQGSPETKRVRAEDLLWNQATKKPMRRTAWVFSGSSFARDPQTKKLEFLAQIERKLVAVYRDPAAIFNSPLDTGRDDIFYVINEKAIPKPSGWRCPRHEEKLHSKPGKCPQCGAPLAAVGRPVKMIMTPAPPEALKPENLTDGADLMKSTGEENPPGRRPVPVPKKEEEKK